MKLHTNVAYKTTDDKENKLAEDDLNDFENTANEFKKSYDPEFNLQILSTSQRLLETASKITVFPTKIIVGTDIINNCGSYLNSFQDIQFALNILKTIKLLISKNSFALSQLIQSNPGELLIQIHSSDNLELKSVIPQIIICFSNTEQGSQYIIHTPLFQFVVYSTLELLQICTNETDAYHPCFDAVLEYLSIFHNLLQKQSEFLFRNQQYFIQIVQLCYSIPPHISQSTEIIKFGICVLFYLSNSNFNQIIIENKLFSQTMNFLNDERYQNIWSPALSFAAKFVEQDDYDQEPMFNDFEATQTFLYHIFSLIIGFNDQNIQDVEEIDDYDDMINQDEEETDDETSKDEENQPLEETSERQPYKEIHDEGFLSAAYSFLANFCFLSSDYVQIILNYEHVKEFMEKTIACLTMCHPKTRDFVYGFVWNILYTGMREQKMQILLSGVMDVLPDSIEFENTDFLIMIENSIFKIFESFQAVQLASPFDEFMSQFHDMMKELSEHENQAVREKALTFLKTYS